jgi:TetR/AcrR family transcriptional regulator
MPTKTYLPADERRARTVAAVVDICAREDPARITTGNIAEHMHVTQGALFKHFPSKDAIWEAVASWAAEQVMSRLEEAAAGTGNPIAALEAMFHAHIDFIAQHPGVPRLLVGQLQHDRQTPARRVVRSLLLRYRECVRDRLAEASQSGLLRPGLDLDAAATQFIGTVQGLVLQALMLGDMARIGGMAAGVFAIYLHGIRKDPERAR